MTKTLDRSDLLEWAEHEHAHLDRLFHDLRETFAQVAEGDVGDEHAAELIDQAVDDLRGALDDMLEHFNEEEEVFFVAIEGRFPELGDQITQLVHTHESICRRVKRMTHQLSRPLPQVRADVRSLSVQLDELVGTLEEHNDEEQKIFAAALKNLTSDERIELLDKKLAL
jgi:iron-sulfur cluster repair protein YtfE (RIC family)